MLPYCAVICHPSDSPPTADEVQQLKSINYVCKKYPVRDRRLVAKLLAGMPANSIRMDLRNAMAKLQENCLAGFLSLRRRQAVETIVRKLYYDSQFQKLPVRIIALAIFQDLDTIFFGDKFQQGVYLGSGDAVQRNARGVTYPGNPVVIEISATHFDTDLAGTGSERRDDILEVLIHEMCHAYPFNRFERERSIRFSGSRIRNRDLAARWDLVREWDLLGRVLRKYHLL
ncbi:hypothetical protein CISG_08441 [Coccidioides immitis RMSCC 3703]|uniref:Uncharacterized protein n=1 Tax=Coccidioides immitis RMSCC 3703 TaxID=454286 RepID=A0A0J8R4T1_COCIT|nr:hypothetical protein CISG_08441 [Coccidioides immitis RMSCC 3703]